MSEFITLHLGGCGIDLGKSYWDLVLSEHQVTNTGQISPESQTSHVHRALKESPDGSFSPRALFIDSEDTSIHNLLRSKNSVLYKTLTECLNDDSGGVYPISYCQIFNNNKEKLFESLRKQAESTEKLENFLLFHSAGGGTGSGLSTAFCHSLRDEYQGVGLTSIMIHPSKELGRTVTEIYNSSLCYFNTINSSDIIYIYDNLALHNMCVNNLSELYSSFPVVNDLCAHSLACLTSVFRFSDTKISDFNKSLLVGDSMKLITPSFAPISLSGNASNDWKSVCSASMEPANTMARSDLGNKSFVKGKFVFRGEIERSECERIADEVVSEAGGREGRTEVFCGRKAGECSEKVEVGDKTVGMFANSQAVVDIFDRLRIESELLYSRRAFVYSYIGYGMQDEDIGESIEFNYRMIQEYREQLNFK